MPRGAAGFSRPASMLGRLKPAAPPEEGDLSHPTDLVSALAASRERLFELLERVPFGVVSLAADGKTSWGNRAARAMLGEDAEFALGPLRRALAGEMVRQERVDAGSVVVEVSAAALPGEDGRVAFAIASLVDVTG